MRCALGRSRRVLGRHRRMNRYDHLGRRVTKIAPDGTHTFLYDGWRTVVETIAKSDGGGTDRIEYHWGKDLSGSLDGAAGVGGLLYVKRNGAIYVPFCDAFGNVMGYWDENGVVVAEYAYDAFGRTVAKSGTMADMFSVRYSTKYYDAETWMYYYGKRYYVVALCRWLTRDPIEEQGGVNLYGFCGNNGVAKYDADGRAYFAKRRLLGVWWLPGLSINKWLDSVNAELSHENLFFEDGKLPSNIGCFDRVDDNPGSDNIPGLLSNYVVTERGYDDCVMREAVKIVTPKPYSLLGFGDPEKYNCQNYAQDLRSAYFRLLLDKDVCCKCRIGSFIWLRW